MEDIILQMESYIVGVGPWGPIVYVFMMIVAIVIAPIPSSPLAIFAGTIFGTWWASLWTMLGATIGAMIAFWIARRFGRPVVEKIISKEKLSKIEEKFSENNLILTVFLLRLLPLPLFDAVSYAAGLTHISVRGFISATFFGLLPLVFLFSYMGNFLAENIVLFSLGVIVFSILLLAFMRIYYNNKDGIGGSESSISKARFAKQRIKQENLDKILILLKKKGEVDNKDIKHLLKMSQTSATRYMDLLEQTGKVEQVGDAGRGVFYRLKK